jgi:hypothetical protein
MTEHVTPGAHLLAIDPGPAESGFVVLDPDNHLAGNGIVGNDELLPSVASWKGDLAIEWIAAYGMTVGAEVFDTCLWVGRFLQAYHAPANVHLVFRRDVKQAVCHNGSATDSNIRQGLIDMLGPKGVKANPGPLYGITKHAWAALGVAVTVRGIETRPTPPVLIPTGRPST